jgi:hypothetical protein
MVLWPLLTSGCSAVHCCTGCDEGSPAPFHHLPSRPPRVRVNNLRPMEPPHLHHRVRVVSDFALSCKFVRPVLPCMRFLLRTRSPVRGGGFRTLPSASFKFNLAMDTLAVRLTLPTTKRVADFHRQVTTHAGCT